MTDRIEIACMVRRIGEKQIAVADGMTEMHGLLEREKWFWLPKSQLTVAEPEGAGMGDIEPGQMVTLSMPEWLARDRGLI